MLKVQTICGHVEPFDDGRSALSVMHETLQARCEGGIPLRLAFTVMKGDTWNYEVEFLRADDKAEMPPVTSPFALRERRSERTHAFNTVMLIPTGIDCSIGGHAGDATTVARLLASVSDTVILNPNVVNASDVNEQTENCLYVEGSLITRLMTGTISLQRVRKNRILFVTESRSDGAWVVDQIVNTASAARATLGIDCAGVVVLEKGLSMSMGQSPSGRAVGEISGFEPLLQTLASRRGTYDAVALSTKISPPGEVHALFDQYFAGEGPNPWGGVEAALTHTVSGVLNIPSAHAPTLESLSLRSHSFGRTDPRKAAESISMSYTFCLCKGLHRAPAVIEDPDGIYDPSVVATEDVSCLVIPDGCVGVPTLAALIQRIPVIAVRGNENIMRNDLSRLPFAPGQLHYVDNYLEAAGLIMAMRAGIDHSSILRPLAPTLVEVARS